MSTLNCPVCIFVEHAKKSPRSAMVAALTLGVRMGVRSMTHMPVCDACLAAIQDKALRARFLAEAGLEP